VTLKLRTNYTAKLCRKEIENFLKGGRRQGKKTPRLNLLPRNNQGINPLCSPAPKTKTARVSSVSVLDAVTLIYDTRRMLVLHHDILSTRDSAQTKLLSLKNIAQTNLTSVP